MQFFSRLPTFLQLATHPHQYPQLIRDFRARTVIFYYLLLNFLILAIPALIAIPNLTDLRTQVINTIEDIPTHLPSDAIITLQDQVLTTNLEEPYVIGLQPDGSNTITIDTQGNIEDFHQYNTGFLVTARAVAGTSSDSQLRLLTFDQIEDNTEPLTLTHTTLVNLVSIITPYITQYFTPALIAIGTLGVILSSIIGSFGFVYWHSVLVSLTLWLGNIQLPFAKRTLISATLGIFTSTLSLFWQLLPSSWPTIHSLIGLPTLLYLIILIPATISLRDSRKTTQPWRKTWAIILATLLAILLISSLS